MPDYVPKVGEWWSHVGSYGYKCGWGHLPTFYIEDIIVKDDFMDSWVIYSNNDNSDDFFVHQMWQFIQGNWEKANGADYVDEG